MKTSPLASALFATCVLSLSSVALAGEEQAPATEPTKPASTLTKKERDWIEDKCKMQHPMNMEHRHKCIEKKEKNKAHEKAEKEHKK